MLATNNSSSTLPTSTEPHRHESRLSGWRKLIDKQYADIPICLCSFVSGLCDSASFNASAVFVSMQTGNTLFLAIGAAHLPPNVPYMWLRAITSIGCFMLGCFCFSKLRHVQPLRKGTLAFNFLTQALFIIVAAALAQSGVASPMADLYLAEKLAGELVFDFKLLIPIGLLAFQFGGQIVTSRMLGYNEVPTNVLTSLYCDLFSDPLLFSPLSSNPKRNRRIASAILFFLGGLSGAWLAKSDAGMGTALWIGGAVKFVIAFAWLGWKEGEINLEKQ
ncbi:Nn.00g070340.m01.CDS01 [Neocucurbitaria sp. VM-36]